MKSLLLFFALIILLATFTACDNSAPANSSPAATTAPTPSASFPKEEAEKLIKRLATQDGCKDSTAEMRLSFTDSDGKPQQMDFRLQRKYEGSKISTLMTILAPKEESEKALLAFEEEGKPTDAISYLAGLKKVAHLKSDNPLNFRGSKSSVQEMLGLELGKYEITSIKLGKSNPSDEADLIIYLSEKKGMNLAYPKISVSFREAGKNAIESGDVKPQNKFLPSLFTLQDSKDETVKQMEINRIDWRKPDNEKLTIMVIDITDTKNNNQKLKLETRNIKYDTNLPASIFTEVQLIKAVTAASEKQLQ